MGCAASTSFNGGYLVGASIFAFGSNDVVDNIEHFKAPINLPWWPVETCNPFRAVCDGIPCNTSLIHGEYNNFHLSALIENRKYPIHFARYLYLKN